MGIPFAGRHDGDDDDSECYAFVRVSGGELRVHFPYEVVASCTHCGMDGPVTEALVSGQGVRRYLSRECPDVLKLVGVRDPDWLEQAIMVASGAHPADGGLLAVSALRAPREELTLVSHPGAPCGALVLSSLAGVFASLGVRV